MKVGVIGAGAFGTSLAIALASKCSVTIWARDIGHLTRARASKHLPDVLLPASINVTGDLADIDADVCLLAIPTQQLTSFLTDHAPKIRASRVVLCSKGIDLKTGLGPAEVLRSHLPDTTAAVLSGPSFAVDIAQGKPTALTLATASAQAGQDLQHILSTEMLRIYRSTDVTGVQIGGALKNVVAIGCGAAMGAGLGESARSALITRGFAEMVRFATASGAQVETLSGLSGLGDLVLTATSDKSRNYRFGKALGAGEAFGDHVTVEGAATAQVLRQIAKARGIEMPVCEAIASLVAGDVSVATALRSLLARPLREE